MSYCSWSSGHEAIKDRRQNLKTTSQERDLGSFVVIVSIYHHEIFDIHPELWERTQMSVAGTRTSERTSLFSSTPHPVSLATLSGSVRVCPVRFGSDPFASGLTDYVLVELQVYTVTLKQHAVKLLQNEERAGYNAYFCCYDPPPPKIKANQCCLCLKLLPLCHRAPLFKLLNLLHEQH